MCIATALREAEPLSWRNTLTSHPRAEAVEVLNQLLAPAVPSAIWLLQFNHSFAQAENQLGAEKRARVVFFMQKKTIEQQDKNGVIADKIWYF